MGMRGINYSAYPSHTRAFELLHLATLRYLSHQFTTYDALAHDVQALVIPKKKSFTAFCSIFRGIFGLMSSASISVRSRDESAKIALESLMFPR